MPVTTPDSLHYPQDSDPPDIPKDMELLAWSVQDALTGLKVQGSIPMFASDAARDAAFTEAGITPQPGMLVWNGTIGAYQIYTGTKWVYGWYVSARGDTDVALPSGVEVIAPFEATDTQPSYMEPIAWSGAEVTIPATGIYSLDYSASVIATFDATLGLQMYQGTTPLGVFAVAIQAGMISTIARTILYPFASGDKVKVGVTCSGSAGTLLGFALRVVKVANP